MRPLKELGPERLMSLKGVLADIDDTISTGGKLTAEAFEALWRLEEAGLITVIVTGRPAGWCDHIARFWPVRAVVGENGGFYFHHDGRRLRRRFIHGQEERRAWRAQLDRIRDEILREVPGCAVTSDQPYRECDLAIDYREDVAPLPLESASKIQSIFERHGARAKISSIHVNGWFGHFDKLSTAQLCLEERFGIERDHQKERFLFCGDSPNDGPMFGHFPLSVGVANLKRYEGLIERLPPWTTRSESGAGFRELVDYILARGSY
jgi:HAD superfamily hydrolase (TIGR01484 family)